MRIEKGIFWTRNPENRVAKVAHGPLTARQGRRQTRSGTRDGRRRARRKQTTEFGAVYGDAFE